MKLRSVLILLLSMTTVLMIVQTTAAAAGRGGKGGGAATAIDFIRLNDPPPQGGEILAEISGGGFLGGEFVEVTLDGVAIPVVADSAQLLIATIPAALATDGDHEIVVRTGDDNKQSDSATISLGGEMIVSCISWFVSGPADEHVHTEVHVEDLDGNAVIGASVVWEAENPSGVVYQTNASLTGNHDGHAHGENCPVDANGDPDVSGSGVTDWFCCIGAGKFDADGPPGKRACEEGTYTARIISVTAPLFTNMVWEETNPDNELEASIDLVDPRFP